MQEENLLNLIERARKTAEAAKKMPKAIIFDLNGVFIQGPKLSDRFRDDFGVQPEIFLPVLKEIMAKIRMPNAGDCYSFWASCLEKWGVKMSAKQFYDYWFGTEKEVPEMIELAKDSKDKGIKIFVLSNNFVERAAYYENNFSFLKEIPDKIYYSWQTGFVKPSIEAYKKVLADNRLKGEECVYFDDSMQNIEAAESLGIKSYIFESAENTNKILSE